MSTVAPGVVKCAVVDCDIARSGMELPIHGDGTSTRSYLHVDDVAEAYMTVLRKGTVGETYNIGTQKERTVVDVARDIAAIFNMSEDKIVHVNDRAFNDQYAQPLERLPPNHGRTLQTRNDRFFLNKMKVMMNTYRNRIVLPPVKVGIISISIIVKQPSQLIVLSDSVHNQQRVLTSLALHTSPGVLLNM
jgi:NAD dependent epimerase/dehydratase family